MEALVRRSSTGETVRTRTDGLDRGRSRGARRLLTASAAAVLATLATGILAAAPAQAQSPGDLVSGFGGSGVVTQPTGTQLFGVAVQSNGDVVAVGQTGGKVLVEQFTSAGAPAGTYTGPAGVARAVAVEANGDIVLAGSSGSSMLVERLTSSLTPDSSFGSNGSETAFAGQSAVANAVAIGPDGSIVAAGSTSPSPGLTEFGVVKYDASGKSQFSQAFNFGADSIANGVAIQSNGDILLVGSQRPSQDTNGVIARLTSAGTLDTSFAGSGATTYHYPGGGFTSFTAVALQGDGNVVVSGADAGGPNALLLRYTSAGALDSSFGSAGVTAFLAGIDIAIPGAPVGAYGVGIAGGGTIVGVGQFERTGGEYDAAVWATTSAGAPDASFGTAGAITQSTGLTGLFENCALAVAPDGTLVAVGNTVTEMPDNVPCSVDSGAAGFLVEYTGFGPPPPGEYTPGGSNPGGGSSSTPLKLSFKGLAATEKTATVAAHGLKVGVSCSEQCALKLSLVLSAGNAKRLHILTKYKKCTKVKGKQHCQSAKGYLAVTLASGKASLKASGTTTTTLKLSKAYVKALEKQASISVSLQVSGTSTLAAKGASIKKNLAFKR